MSKKRRIYLDYSASTPVDPRVLEAMMPYFSDIYGNPSSAHSYGRDAERAIEEARETIASVFNCKSSEVVFTSGGSESDNLAVRGAAWMMRHQEKRSHLVTTPIEHPAVGATMKQLAEIMDYDLQLVAIDESGLVDLAQFEEILSTETALASIVYASNEIGTVQPLAHLSQLARSKGVVFHTDAVQAAGQLSLDVQELGVDLLSISAHKFYGPKGVGALFVRDGIKVIPSQSGGSHESGRRAGTHNTPFIVGMAKALELAYQERDERIARLTHSRALLIDGILSRIPQARLSGHPEHRLPSHTSFVIPGIDANTLLIHMDLKGVAGSSGSACKTGNPEPSSILLALGYDRETALSGLRLTLSHHTTDEDVESAIEVIADSVTVVEKLHQTLAR